MSDNSNQPEGFKAGKWKPGQSGNPSGRPKGLERTAREAMKLREYTAKDGKTYTGTEAAFQCLIDMIFDSKVPPQHRVAAFKEWCDRGFGKSKQFVEVTDGNPATAEGRPAEDMTDEQLREALAAIGTLKRLGGIAAPSDTEH